MGAGGALDPEKQEIRGREWEIGAGTAGETGIQNGWRPVSLPGRRGERIRRRGGGGGRQEAGKATKTFFHLLPGGKGRAVIGGMTESLIGAVGLKEFVFGTSFLSVSSKDQDSSEASPSSSLSVSASYPPWPARSVSWRSSRPLFSAAVCLCLCFSLLLRPSPSLCAGQAAG